MPENPAVPLLEVRDLRVSFRTEEGVLQAVDGLSLTVGAGEVVGIVGESGSGKTVSVLAVMRLIRDPNAVIEGEALLRGQDLMKLSSSEMRAIRPSPPIRKVVRVIPRKVLPYMDFLPQTP